jgi:hypothetical protein
MYLWQYRWRQLGYVLVVVILMTCQNGEPSTVQSAFYHWETELELDSLESSYLSHLSASRLYVKFFDVDWNAQRQAAVPLANLQVQEWKNEVAIIPTVFITNRTLQKVGTVELDDLAKRIWTKIQVLATDLAIQEIQMDCDWSESTQEAYFSFLEHLKNLLPDSVQLSVTLRLHQYRYPEMTGVPPVDRAMLMCYNVGEVRKWEEENSILRTSAVKPYLEVNTYALPLDFALPLFRWGVLFRHGEMIKLIDGLQASDLADTTYFRQTAPQRYELVKSTYLQGYYLYRGDQLRLESVGVKTLQETARLLAEIKRSEGPFYVAFYRLDAQLLETFTYAELEDILARWSP